LFVKYVLVYVFDWYDTELECLTDLSQSMLALWKVNNRVRVTNFYLQYPSFAALFI